MTHACCNETDASTSAACLLCARAIEARLAFLSFGTTLVCFPSWLLVGMIAEIWSSSCFMRRITDGVPQHMKEEVAPQIGFCGALPEAYYFRALPMMLMNPSGVLWSAT